MNQNKVLIIGNSGYIHKSTDGQTVKVRLYVEALKRENISFNFVDLENGSKHLFKIVKQIKKGIKECDRIVLLTASRGIKLFVPLINRFNKQNKPFILPMIGCNIINKYLKNVPLGEYADYFNLEKKINFSKKDSKNISKISLILPENPTICNMLKYYFPNNKIETLQNFRFLEEEFAPHFNNDKTLRLIYLSRICEEKGIMDLIDAVKELNDDLNNITLDIFGKKHLNEENEEIFNYILTHNNFINYLGELNPSQCISKINSYDLFVFPTKYKGEGTPGVLVESLIAGTPILSSKFSNASSILKFGEDSFSFDIGNKEDLKEKIKEICFDKSILKLMSSKCIENSKNFIYKNIRKYFLKYVCGVK